MKDTQHLWITRQQAGHLIGLSARQFDDVLKPRLAGAAVKGRGAALRFDASAVVKSLVDYRLEQAKADDPLMAGSDSPNLERYRAAKAALAELDLEKARLTHVSLSDLGGLLTRFASALRQAGELLQRQFGAQAADAFNAALDSAEQIVKREIRA